jgi:mannonate dehydratase
MGRAGSFPVRGGLMPENRNRAGKHGPRSSRRRFLTLPLALGAAGLILRRSAAASPAKAAIDEYAAGNIKLSHRVPDNISDEDLLFLKQIGLRWARVNFAPERSSFEDLRRTHERFARFGLAIYSGVHYAYRATELQLGQPGRDKYIEAYQQFLRDAGKLGIRIASYDFHPANTYTTNQVEAPRGYTAREFKLSDFRNKVEKQRFEREYSAEEIWENYTYFMKAVLPVAKEAGIMLALHPDDPPLAKMNGVAKVLVHYDGYRRAEQISGQIEGKGSPHWGLTFCVGTWSEGGDQMGKDVFEMIRDFGGRNKIFEIHFRSVSGPLPHFVETFPEEGYMDMYQVMKALREVRFNGMMVPDHVPALAGDKGINRAGTAYCIAYMRALLRRANEEVG